MATLYGSWVTSLKHMEELVNLPGVDGKNYSLASADDAKLLIVVFSCNHCPFVVGSEDRIKAMYANYKPKGVEMIAINSNVKWKDQDEHWLPPEACDLV